MTLEEWTKEISDAARSVAPLSGSEGFIEVEGRYLADPAFIRQRIADLRAALHQARVDAVKAKRAAV